MPKPDLTVQEVPRKKQKLPDILDICAPVTPTTPLKNPQQLENAVAIPDEYDFDLLKLITETDMDMQPMKESAVVPVPAPTSQNREIQNTSNTQINIANQNSERRLPGFFNCSIGKINFNVYNK